MIGNRVDVKLPSVMQEITGVSDVTIQGCSSLLDLIKELERLHPGIEDWLLDGGNISDFVNIYISNVEAREAGGLGANVKNGDTVIIMSAVAGGAE